MLVSAVPKTLDKIDAWVNHLATCVAKPVKVPFASSFMWQFPERTTEVVMVSKLIHLAAEIGGAWQLAVRGQTTGAGSLMRLVDDFSSEVLFIADTIVAGKRNRHQRKFIELFFKPMPTSLKDYLARDRANWVSRSDIRKSQTRMARDAGQDAGNFQTVSGFLNYSLNGYVHGSLESAMELYDPSTDRFELLGFAARTKAATELVASKCSEVCAAVGVAALALQKPGVVVQIQEHLDRVDPTRAGLAPI